MGGTHRMCSLIMDILINLANVLYVVAYFTTNIVRLRLLTLVAASCLAIYFANQPVPMLNVVAWNLGFIALNLFQLLRLLRRSYGNGRFGAKLYREMLAAIGTSAASSGRT